MFCSVWVQVLTRMWVYAQRDGRPRYIEVPCSESSVIPAVSLWQQLLPTGIQNPGSRPKFNKLFII